MQTGFDPSFARLSPGTVLIYLLAEDLILHRPPGRLCFGFGDSYYKREFSNDHSEEVSFLLLNRGLSGAIRAGTYTAFKSLLRAAKTLTRAPRHSPAGAESR